MKIIRSGITFVSRKLR